MAGDITSLPLFVDSVDNGVKVVNPFFLGVEVVGGVGVVDYGC